MGEQQNNKEQKGTWEGNRVTKHGGVVKHHKGGTTKQHE